IENLLARAGLKDSHNEWIRIGGAGQGDIQSFHSTMRVIRDPPHLILDLAQFIHGLPQLFQLGKR
ncbi:MAG: hypothetical protein ABIP55_13680, partial [Tepidisphaeraceae bacterium]